MAASRLFLEKLRIQGGEVVLGEHTLALSKGEPLYLLALGKAAHEQAMAFLDVRSSTGQSLHQSLPWCGGCVISPKASNVHTFALPSMQTLQGDHPVPGQDSFAAGRAVLESVSRLPPNATLLCLLSGGASALLEHPLPGLSACQVSEVHHQLVQSGADIGAMNSIRSSLSQIKNGGLLAATSARRVLTLVTSDVPSKELSMVGSGPTLFQNRSTADVAEAANRWLTGTALDTVINHLASTAFRNQREGVQAALSRKHVQALGLAGGTDLTQSAQRALAAQGIISQGITSQGITCHQPAPILNASLEAGLETWLGHIRQEWISGNLGSSSTRGWVSGGELTVAVPNTVSTGHPGRGGRNSHFVLGAASTLLVENRFQLPPEDLERLHILSLASDGADGNSAASGGWLNLQRIRHAQSQGCDLREAWRRFDSAPYLACAQSQFPAWSTGTNLMDVRAIVLGPTSWVLRAGPRT